MRPLPYTVMDFASSSCISSSRHRSHHSSSSFVLVFDDCPSRLGLCIPLRPCTTQPFISAITVDPDDDLLSTWTLSTRAFDREWTISWRARNLTPMKNRKIHWRSEEGSQVENRGAVRFSDAAGASAGASKADKGVRCELSISYACPPMLAPFAAALGPVVDALLADTMKGFKSFAEGAYRTPR